MLLAELRFIRNKHDKYLIFKKNKSKFASAI